MKIERDKKYNTYNGTVAKAVFFDEKCTDDRPWLMVNERDRSVFWVTEKGHHKGLDGESDLDLISEHREAREWDAWVDRLGKLRDTENNNAVKPIDWQPVRVKEVL